MVDSAVNRFPLSEIDQLRERLEEAEEILDAIRNGRVDALVVPGPGRDQIYTIKGADQSYRIMIETMNEGAVVLSDKGTILYSNRRFAEMLGLSMETVTGRSMADLVTPDGWNSFKELRDQPFQKNGIKAEMQFLTREGNSIPTLVSMGGFSREEIDAVCMVVTDLTELKKTENKLRDYAERLQRKNFELKRRAEQLGRLSSELTMSEQRERQRLAKILHDHLQQLLVSARFSLEALEGRVHEESWRKVENIIDVIKESLDVSRSLTVELSPPVLYEGGLIPAVEWLVRWMDEKHGLAVALAETDSRDCPMREDIKTLLFSSIRELLFNVIKHADTMAARVEVSRPDPRHLRIVVSDHGEGFDPARLGDDTRDLESGFGLFSIRERLSMMGGECRISSSPGQGTSVTLVAPVQAEPDAEDARQGAKAEMESNRLFTAGPDSENAGDHIRVMLVDDHSVMRQGLSMLLSDHADIDVVGESPDGEDAVRLARELDPDVILMDISMPKMNGIEATRIIHSENPDIRIIGLSMFDAAEQAEAIRNAGAAAYLKKSGDRNELLGAIRNAVRAG